MKTGTLIIVSALMFPVIVQANGILCSLGLASSSPVPYTNSCDSQIAYTNTFDWASLNPSVLSSASGPTYQSSANNPHMGDSAWTGTSDGTTVSVSLAASGSYPPYLQLDGNTAWVYDPQARITDNGYIYASAYNTAVALGFPTVDPTNPVAWSFGETLLTEQDPSPDLAAPITISFSQPVSGVGFQISTLSSANFIATLMAYSASGTLLGTYVIDTNGTKVGGMCPSMYSSPGAPCSTPAPWIGITDDELHLGANMIAKVVVYANVPNFAIGSMDLIETPEPSTLLFAVPVLALAGWRRRKAAYRARR